MAYRGTSVLMQFVRPSHKQGLLACAVDILGIMTLESLSLPGTEFFNNFSPRFAFSLMLGQPGHVDPFTQPCHCGNRRQSSTFSLIPTAFLQSCSNELFFRQISSLLRTSNLSSTVLEKIATILSKLSKVRGKFTNYYQVLLLVTLKSRVISLVSPSSIRIVVSSTPSHFRFCCLRCCPDAGPNTLSWLSA